MMIHEITATVGRHKTRKRVGRGEGSGSGCTSGRGHKGAGQRAGNSKRPGFEGGQMPLFRRLPKRGFTNAAFRTDYHVVNIKTLETRFDGDEVTPEALVAAGLIRDTSRPVKILGEGELTKKLTVSAARFSASAQKKIEAAGGSVTVLPGRTKWTRAAASGTKKPKKDAKDAAPADDA